MPYKTSKYTAQQNSEFAMRCLEVLDSNPNAMSIAEIQMSDIALRNVTSQKLSRVLSHLIEMGMAQKAKDKSSGHMVYKSTAVMKDQGYEV